MTFVVSGGGGAPLYDLASLVEGSKTFQPTHQFGMLDVKGDLIELEAFDIDGLRIDRATIPPRQLAKTPPAETRPTERASVREGRDRMWLGAAAAVLAIGFLVVIARIARTR